MMMFVPSNMFKPSSEKIYLPFQGGASFVDPFLFFVFFMFVCHTVSYVPCSLVVTCWERADLTLLYVMLIVF